MQLQVSRECPFPVLVGEQPPLMDLLVTKAWEPLCLLSLDKLSQRACAQFFHVKEAVALRVMRC